jgi:hypothetical protein
VVATSEFEFVEEHVRHLNEHVTPNQREHMVGKRGKKHEGDIVNSNHHTDPFHHAAF